MPFNRLRALQGDQSSINDKSWIESKSCIAQKCVVHLAWHGIKNPCKFHGAIVISLKKCQMQL